MERRIPVFFASDDNYLPYLAVAAKSIADHGTDGNIYDIKILTYGLSEKNIGMLLQMDLPRVEIEVINVKKTVNGHGVHFQKRLRDYYSESIYFRIFIASLFPNLEKAIYIDCDVVLVDDIANLYDVDIKDAILGAVADESIPGVPAFCEYVEEWVGVPFDKYVNSGVLLMNLNAFREARVEELIKEYVCTYNFDTVAPDQDYLNCLCRDKIHYLDPSWNKQPKPECHTDVSKLHLIHYNMFNKPWHYRDVLYAEEFWRVADTTPFADMLHSKLEGHSDEDKKRDMRGACRLLENAQRLAHTSGGFAQTLLVSKR